MATSTGQTPQIEWLTAGVGAVAAGSDASTPAFRVPFTGTVVSVTYVPAADITGANTNTRTLSIKNRGAAGAGTTTVASKALTSGNNMSEFDENALTNSATAADLDVTEGDILSFESIHASSGLADPGGMVVVKISRA